MQSGRSEALPHSRSIAAAVGPQCERPQWVETCHERTVRYRPKLAGREVS